MLKNHDIICFGPSDWWGMNPSCATHIMRALSESNRVIYINPISSDLMGIRQRSGLLKRISRKAKSMLKVIRKINRNMYVFSPVFLPIQGMPTIDRINNALLSMQLMSLLFCLKFKNPILWIENIRCSDIVSKFQWRLIIYHISDFFEKCPYTKNREMLKLRQEHVVQNSDLLICVSRLLYQNGQKKKKNTYYLPHGVDFAKFRKAAESSNTKGKSPLIAGYFGTLTAQNDVELLEYCAVNLPEIRFVFGGQITAGDYSRLKSLKNTLFIVNVDYENIPELCASFDVCLLPWKMTTWIRHCNPLKLFEYMSSGKPIVSVAIDEIVEKYREVISVAYSKEEFCEAIRRELENDTKERSIRRINIARENSWEKHNEHLCELIEKNLSQTSSKI